MRVEMKTKIPSTFCTMQAAPWLSDGACRLICGEVLLAV